MARTQSITPTVDWHLYAEKYDMLLSYNPFYQQLQKEILVLINSWQIEAGDLIADVGAGTGNYSIPLALQFPQARIIHIDNNAGMNERAIQKKRQHEIENLDIFQQGMDEVYVSDNSLKGLVSVHALYTFPDPVEALQKMHGWLDTGGYGILVDPGRVVNVVRWQLAIGWHLVSRHGLSKTLKIFKEAKPVSEQNRIIRHMQRKGELWTHSHEDFCQTVEQAGFTILESRICFRGLSDMVVVAKRV